MAKALIGHISRGPSDARIRETLVLRQRVADLEAEILRLKAENDALAEAYHRDTAAVVPHDIVELEPALSS